MNYSRSKIKLDAKAQISSNYGVMLMATFVLEIIMSCIASFTCGISTLILTGTFYYGRAKTFLRVSRGEKAETNDSFSGFSNFGKTAGAGFLILLFTFLWSLLLIIPGIVAAYSYSMTFYLMLDNPNLTATEAIAKSKELMRGNKMKLFIMDLSFIPWHILSMFTFGILSILYITPYIENSRAHFYNTIVGYHAPNANDDNNNKDAVLIQDDVWQDRVIL